MEPSGNVSEPIASAPEAAIPPDAGAASPEPAGNWLQSALRAVTGRGGARTAAEAPADEQAEGDGSGASREAWSAPSWTTKAEYDEWLGKQQQSYADRRDRDRDRRSALDREQERDQTIARLELEKAEARKSSDTWRVGELQDEIDAIRAGVDREHVQSGALSEFIGALRAEDDAALLDPLIKDLPTATAKKLIEDASARGTDGALLMAPDGLPVGVVTTEARATLAAAALKAIKDAARAEGRADARKDPVLRKELMAQFKATPEAEEQEPVVVSEAPSGSGPRDMNAFLRSVKVHR